MSRSNLFVLAGLVMLSGCSAAPSLSPDFGVSTRENIVLQAVDPRAGEKGVISSGLDGTKVEKAMERYRKDKPEDSRATLVEDN